MRTPQSVHSALAAVQDEISRLALTAADCEGDLAMLNDFDCAREVLEWALGLDPTEPTRFGPWLGQGCNEPDGTVAEPSEN